jgi:ABC-type nitrate/sulfonate/bicarbonate transport system substrate-binding protein
MNAKLFMLLAAGRAVAFAMVLAVTPGCKKTTDSTHRLEELVIANSLAPISAPFFVSYPRGYWAEEGIEVKVHDFAEAKFCFDAVLAGKAQIGNVAETPMALAALQDRKFTVVATFVTSARHIQVIGRRDRGIGDPRDLKGKQIALSVGTAGEYYKDRFLEVHGLAHDDVRVINLKPPDIVHALASGRVDAAVTWEPHITELRHQLGADAIVFPTGDYYTMTSNLVCLPSLIEERPELVERTLRVMLKSVDFLKKNRQESIAVVASRLGMDATALSEMWDNYDFKIALDSSLVRQMEEQSRWAITRGLAAPRTTLPDLRQFIDPRPLRSLSPGAVTLIDPPSTPSP